MSKEEDIARYQADKRRYAGEKIPSMTRRRLGHDYEARRMYLITITVEGRRPLLGHLVGNSQVPQGAEGGPHIVLSPLGQAVEEAWLSISTYHPEVQVVALQLMPDHLHGILFVRERMPQHLGHIIKGFTDLAKPGGQRFDACAEGRMLILAPWEHHNERRTIRRDQCLTLNDMAAMICRGGWWSC